MSVNEREEAIMQEEKMHRSTYRVLKIFELLSATSEGMSLTGLAQKLEIPKGSLHPILKTMQAMNFIRMNDNGNYTIGQAAYFVGSSYTKNSDLLQEIDYVLNRYDLKPAAFVAYDRAAYYGKGNEELRITFDRNICCRCSGLDLKNGVYGTMLLNKDQILMEVKIPGAMPLWMSRLFSDMELFPVSYSKYGAYYKEYLYQVIFIEGGRICA